jgi:hypothetical protein
MRQKSARAIVETLLSNTNKNFDVTALDLFSSWTSNQISKQPVSSFVGTCPIMGETIYGLPVQYNATTCSSRRPVHLYQQQDFLFLCFCFEIFYFSVYACLMVLK